MNTKSKPNYNQIQDQQEEEFFLNLDKVQEEWIHPSKKQFNQDAEFFHSDKSFADPYSFQETKNQVHDPIITPKAQKNFYQVPPSMVKWSNQSHTLFRKIVYESPSILSEDEKKHLIQRFAVQTASTVGICGLLSSFVLVKNRMTRRNIAFFGIGFSFWTIHQMQKLKHEMNSIIRSKFPSGNHEDLEKFYDQVLKNKNSK